MFRTSRLLRGASTVVAGATIVLGLPSAMIAANAASGASGHTLVFNDCAVQPTGTTTSTTSTTGNGDDCTTQASVGTVKTLTVTLTNTTTHAPVSGADIDFSLAESGGTTANSAFFPNSQPNGTSSNTTNSGQTATCTTNGSGQCSVNVTDTEAEMVTVTATERGAGGAVSDENVDFRTGSTAPARLDQSVDQGFVGPENDSPQTDSPDSTNRARYSPNAGPGPTPGRPIQLTYTLYDTSQGENSDCAAATNSTPDNFSTCTGNTLAGVPLTLHLSGTAFFTNNCTPPDVNGTPSRDSGNGAVAPTNSTPGTPSNGTLDNPRYHNCTFNSTPADGVATGDIKSLGQSLQVVTDQNGQFTVTVGIARDPSFDDDGFATTQLTATAGNATLTARHPGETNAQNGANCTTTNHPNEGADGFGGDFGAGEPGSGPPVSGCAVAIEFRTRGTPLNGATAKIVPVASGTFGAGSNNGTLSDSGTNNIPNNQFRVFVVHLTDQYGNLVLPNANEATLTKSGVGDFWHCDSPASNANPCPNPSEVEQSQDPNSTTSFTGSDTTAGSFTDLDFQDRFAVDAEPSNSGEDFNTCDTSQFGTCTFDVGTQTVTLTWPAPVTTFYFTNTGPNNSPVWQGYHYTSANKTDMVTINYYAQAPTNVTLSVTPSNSVQVGTVVTVTVTVTDQQGNPVGNQNVQFTRSGSNADCSATTSPPAGQQGALKTDNNGKASFSFTCNQVSNQTVTVTVTDPNGNPVAPNKSTTIAFTSGSQPPPSNSASSLPAYRSGNSNNFRGSLTSGPATSSFGFGNSGDVPLWGDWNGDGTPSIGVYRPSNRTFYLGNNSNNAAAFTVTLGNAGDVPVAGDFNGDGTTTIGLFRPSNGHFYLTDNDHTVNQDIHYGQNGDRPLIGDWTGTGHSQVGVYRPSTGVFFRIGHAGIKFGNKGDTPIVGDWDGNGTTTIGVVRVTTWFVSNNNSTAATSFTFGATGARPFTWSTGASPAAPTSS